jgi:predicted enzyme related to lactoylglutathione lyase
MNAPQVPCQVAHFSINADDVDRARNFYETVFGWKFHAYGPPGFFMIEMTPANQPPAPLLGSLQGRRELVEGVKLHGYECSIAVADIDATIKAIENSEGKIVMPKCTLPGIGRLIFFQDPEGNLAGAMEYDTKAE